MHFQQESVGRRSTVALDLCMYGYIISVPVENVESSSFCLTIFQSMMTEILELVVDKVTKVKVGHAVTTATTREKGAMADTETQEVL